MLFRISLLPFFTLLCLQLQAQELPIPYHQNTKWGFVDTQKNILISPQYDEVYPFLQDTNRQTGKVEAFANIKLNEKWGIINLQNKVIIPPQYSQPLVWDAQNGLFYASNFGDEAEDTYFFILNSAGKEIFQCAGYLDWRGFDEEGIAYASVDDKVGFINREGTILVPFEYEHWSPVTEYCHGEGLFGVLKNDKFGFVNAQNEVVIPFMFDHIPEFMGCFQGGKAKVSLDGLVLIIDKEGKIIETPTYKSILDLDTLGYSIAIENTPSFYSDFVLLDSKTGKKALDTSFDYLYYEAGLFSVIKNEKHGLLSAASLEYIQEITSDGYPMHYQRNGEFLWQVRENGLSGIISSQGKVLLPKQYAEIHGRFSQSDYVIVKSEKSYFVVNTKNKVIKKLPFKNILSNYLSNQYFVTENQEGLQGVTRCDGKEIIPTSYQRVTPFGEVFFVLKSDNTQTLIDNKGKRIGKDVLDNYKFVGYYPLGNLHAEVSQGGKLGVLDPKGKLIVPCKYDKIMTIANSDKLFWVQENGLFGLRDCEKMIISPRYTEVTDSSQEINKELYLLIGSEGKRGYIDLQGNEFFE